MRNTPQCKAVYSALQVLHHATNQQLLAYVHKDMPDLSSTTVHRITKRLVEDGQAQYSGTTDGGKLVDVRTDAHDHFICTECKGVIDITIDDNLKNSIQQQIGSNLAGQITISGTCALCVTK